jgi:hypothetical protein
MIHCRGWEFQSRDLPRGFEQAKALNDLCNRIEHMIFSPNM